MHLADTKQSFQDWFTQQWVILRGRKINMEEAAWLKSPFGNTNGSGYDYITQLAKEENLIIEDCKGSKGLLGSFKALNLPDNEMQHIPTPVIDFYENTSEYDLQLGVKWNPLFKPFGKLVNRLFSNRINQLNIPTKNSSNTEPLTNEIIRLVDPDTNIVKYTIWLRRSKTSNHVVYLGVYGICTLPSGATCVKAVFPLPKGNATVLLTPGVGNDGEFTLYSSGKRMGDAGFYFLLNDKKGNTWARYHRSFRDKLTVKADASGINAEQVLTLWHVNVLRFKYTISRANKQHHEN